MPKKVKKTLEQAAKRREEHIKGRGAVWEREAIAATPAYKSGFGPFLTAQVACSNEVLAKGLTGYDALAAYAACMATKGKEAMGAS